MKTIPKFKNEYEEIEFWQQADSSEYINWNDAKKVVFPNLKPSNKNITINLDDNMMNRLLKESKKINISYENLINRFIKEGIEKLSK